MSSVWRWVSLRHLFHEGGRTALTLLGVALGVSVLVSISLANHSAMASFAQTVDSVAGKANLQVVSDSGGFDERLFPRIRDLPDVQAAAPVVQAYALGRPGGAAAQHAFRKGEEVPYQETLLLLGIDLFSEEPFGRFRPPKTSEAINALRFFTDPGAAAVTRSFAERYHLTLGSPFTILSGGRPVTLTIRYVIDSEELQNAVGGNVVLLDIAAAQDVFRRWGKLDRIDMIVDPVRRDAVESEIRPMLPPQARVSLPQGRTRQVEGMVEAFSLNLTALSFIALFVSMFLIFNTVSMAVLRRRREIGILRSLGQTRREVILQFLAEALFLGVAGSAAGLLLGTLMARATLQVVARTLSTLYLVVQAKQVYLDPVIYVTGFLVGTGTAVLSALAPAIEASRTPPSVTVRQGLQIEGQGLPIRRLTLAGAATLLLAAALSFWTVSQHRPMGGFGSAFLLLIGFSLLSPAFTLLCERWMGGTAGRIWGVAGLLGARYMREALARTSVVVAALMVSVGMMIGLSTMVGSFRKTVSIWVNQTLKGDLYVEPLGRSVSGAATVLSPEVVEAARNMPGVAAVDTYRGVEITYEDRLAYVVGIDFEVQARYGRLQFMNGTAAEILARALREGGVIVTESFAFRHRVRAGETVTLATPTGTVRLPIAGVFYDYSTDAGAVMLDYHLYRRLWKDFRTENVAIYLQPGVDVTRARQEFIRRVGDRAVLNVTPNQDLRRRVLRVFDQTFQITYALQTIAIMVAVLGVITTLTSLILQRGQEIGVLRAVGALRGQVRKMVLVESGLLGLTGALMGCVCGAALAVLLTYVINKQFFGWSIRLTMDPWLFVQAVGLMLVTAVLSGLAPARLAASRVAAEAMRAD